MDEVKKILWYLIAGSLGGINRARIIHILRERPYNANQLTEQLGLDYKTVRYHIDVLEKNGLVSSMGDNYAKMYTLSSLLEHNIAFFDKIWDKVGKTDNRPKKDKEG